MLVMLVEEAWRMILDDIVVIPLHRQMIVWAMREGLDLPVSPLNSPTFSRAKMKERLAVLRVMRSAESA